MNNPNQRTTEDIISIIFILINWPMATPFQLVTYPYLRMKTCRPVKLSRTDVESHGDSPNKAKILQVFSIRLSQILNVPGKKN